MFLNFLLIIVIIIFSTLYLNKFRERNKSFIIFFIIFISTSLLYLQKGNLESYFFEERLKSQIEEIFDNPEKLKDVDPDLIIIYLEKKLDNSPDDIQGLLILARTCVLSGYYQKADLHYKNALKKFPNNSNLLLEYSILKKNLNQTEGALKLLFQFKSNYSKNIKGRELIIEILYENQKFLQAEKEISELIEIKRNDQEYIKKLKKKYKLN